MDEQSREVREGREGEEKRKLLIKFSGVLTNVQNALRVYEQPIFENVRRGKISEHQHEIFSAVHKILEYFCTQNKISEPVRNKFFKKLQEESFEHPDEILGEATATCLRLLDQQPPTCGALGILRNSKSPNPERRVHARGLLFKSGDQWHVRKTQHGSEKMARGG
jgi:hypothetical protein